MTSVVVPDRVSATTRSYRRDVRELGCGERVRLAEAGILAQHSARLRHVQRRAAPDDRDSRSPAAGERLPPRGCPRLAAAAPAVGL